MRVLLLTPLALLAACSAEKAPAPAPSTEAAVAAPMPPQPRAQTPVTAREVHEENDLYVFDYSYPASAGAVPALKALLDSELDEARTRLKAEAQEGRKAATEGGFPFRPYSHSVKWEVVTDLPAWLSMSTLVGFDSGGAHPNYMFDALLWDRIAAKRRAAVELFTSKAALAAALREPFCKDLDRQRAKKRGGQDGGLPEFDECIDPTEQTVILGSSNGKAFNRIGILIAPYAAGPYVEGDYEVTLPVTQKVLDAVRPEFKAAFVAG